MMRGRRPYFLMLMLLVSVARATSAESFMPHKLIVKIAPSSSAAAVLAEIRTSFPLLQKNAQNELLLRPMFGGSAHRAEKSGLRSEFPADHYAIVTCSSDSATEAVYELLGHSSLVQYVQRDYIYTIDAIPNDSAVASQWSLKRIGVLQLWDEGFFSVIRPLVKVGVLDTGVDYLHPDLADAIAVNAGETGLDALGRDKRTNGVDDDGNGFVDDWHGYNFAESESRSNDPADVNGHGTSVAGIIGAVANNTIGVAGVAHCAVMPLRAFNAGGNGDDADVAAAIVYGVENGCSVINMSFGVTVLSPLMRDVVAYAVAQNVALVASSGNDGSIKPHYPSDLPGVISVGSVSQYDARSYFSSYSPALCLSAPGENIVTTQNGGGYTASFSGTSAAAPHVAGAVAVVKSLIAADPVLAARPFTPAEFRTLLAATADDIGNPGWDNELGAGVVNVHRAVQTIMHNTVAITDPRADAVLTGEPLAITGTAVLTGMTTLTLSFGSGENPEIWTQLASYENRYFFGDTIAVWNPGAYPDEVYTLRLAATNIAGTNVESRIRVYLKRSAPTITSFVVDDSMIVGDEYGALIRVNTDRATTATLMLRPADHSTVFRGIQSTGIQKDHYFILTSKDLTSGVPYEVSCRAEDNAHQTAYAPVVPAAGAALPTVSVGLNRIPTTGFTALPYSLPAGYLLDNVAQFRMKPTVVVNQYDASNNFGALKSFQFSNGTFNFLDSLVRQWVPRDLGTVNGSLATLVQDRGITKIIGSDSTAGKLFARDVFGDSSDVWGSQLYDLDGDGKLDMIARSSSEYLLYRNLGGNAFSLAARLPDPTAPLPGEAINQFGPPKTLVGKFSGSGKTEIVFADYDGDMLMYRQSGSDPFHFTLAWTDTTSLYETSEYLAAGDFDGDGTPEIAIAGHSNLDLNADREYDAPIWTVRIFSHPASTAPGTMVQVWEQKFAGVNAGFQNDNGISTGKVSSTRDQLLLSLNPYLYLVQYDQHTQNYTPIWIHDAKSNTALVYDFNGNGSNDVGFNTGDAIHFFEHSTAGTDKQAPWGVTAEQTSETTLRLHWNSTAPSGTHQVTRETGDPKKSARVSTVNGTEFIDSTVVPETLYHYTVATVSGAIGEQSAVTDVFIEHQLRMVSAAASTPTQLQIGLSAELDRSRFSSATIAVDDTIAALSVISGTPKSILATFGRAFGPGTHAVRIGRLFTTSGLENDTTQQLNFSGIAIAPGQFGITEARLVGTNGVQLRFNRSLSSSSLRKEYFTVQTAAKIFFLAPPVADAKDSSLVLLTTASGEALTALGLRIEVTVSPNVVDRTGEALNDGKGQSMSFGVDVATLDHVVVFPNPLRYLIGLQDRIKFVNIPPRCRVEIFTANGHKVIEQPDLSTADGLTWNLRDEHGNLVSSGVYIYRLELLDGTGGTLKTTLGKFAIIR
jgi:subtilisin family serine protease